MVNPKRNRLQRLQAHNRRLKRRWSKPLVAVLLLILAALLIFRDTAPLRTEQVLQRASLSELVAASKRDPDNPRVFYYLGLRAQQAGQGAQAMQAFWRAGNLDPDNEKLWLLWSQTAFSVQGSQAARDILLTFVKNHPQNTLMQLQLAKLLEQNGGSLDAFGVAQKVTKQDPHNVDAWQLFGKAALDLHDATRAEAAFRQAIALRPQDSFNHAGLGDALFLMARYPEAATAYQDAVRLAPEIGTGYMALGQAQLKTAVTPAELETARTNLQQALARPATIARTGIYTTYLGIGQSYERQAQWKEALPWLKRAEAIQPPNPETNDDVHFDLASVYKALNDSDDSARETTLHQQMVAYFVQAKALSSQLTNHPDDTQTGLRLARLFLAHHDTTDANKTFRSVLAYAADKQAVRQEMAAVAGRDSGAK
jgi:tetratricopeptide (TPR) repeat protein